MSDSIRLRRAREDDIPFLMCAERGEGAGREEDYDRFVGRSTAEEHRAFQSDPTRVVWIAEAGGQAIGYVLVQDLDNAERAIRLRRVVALTPGRGFATRALPALLDWSFEEAGAHRVWLHTRHDNARARHVYEKIGMVLEDPGTPGPVPPARQCIYAVTRAAWVGREGGGPVGA